jgi:hypothetical protein
VSPAEMLITLPVQFFGEAVLQRHQLTTASRDSGDGLFDGRCRAREN